MSASLPSTTLLSTVRGACALQAAHRFHPLKPIVYLCTGHTTATICCSINDRGTNPSGERSWALQQQSSNGWSALHIAAAEGKNAVEIVRCLLDLGVDPELKDNEGRTALDLAQWRFDQSK